MEVKEIFSPTWKDFKHDAHELALGPDGNSPCPMIFRGQGSAKWQLSPTFDRRFKLLSGKVRDKIEKELLRNFRSACENDSSLQPLLSDEDRMWALGQHHGLPTRLLDWTESPYVAAFFAFQSHFFREPGEVDEDENVAVWALNLSSDAYGKARGVSIVRPSSFRNERLEHQFGYFTRLETLAGSLEEHIDQYDGTDGEYPLVKIILPATEARPAMVDLDLMGVSHFRLFPDLEGRARTAFVKTLLHS